MARKQGRGGQSGDLGGQVSLFGGQESPDPFRKAVQVLHSKPRSPLSLLQRKLGNAWLKHAIENACTPDGWWELGIGKLAQTIGFDSNNRQYLKESAEALMRIVFEWDVIAPDNKRVQWKASVLFPEIEIHSDVIRYQISAQMREHVLNPEIYALIDMTIAQRFRRAPSLAIWEFCVRFEGIGRTAEMHWEPFRDMILGESADSKTYQQYKYFKSKVLLPAIAEINSESNHKIELIEERVGRRVNSVRFKVRAKVAHQIEADDPRTVELHAELIKLGLLPSEVRRLVRSNPFDAVKGALEYTKRRLGDRSLQPLANPAAYFRHALTHRYASADGADASAPDQAEEPRKVDIKEAYMARQISEAEAYFRELDPDDQTAMLERYNEKQTAAPLRMKQRATKVAQTAFYRWLAIETWGEPSAETLLEFAQHVLTSNRG